MFKRVIILFVLIIGLIGFNVVEADEKYYNIKALDIEAVIMENGDLQITKTLDYEFNGDFNGVYVNLYGNHNYSIDEVKIIHESGDNIIAEEGYSEEENTYEFNYTDEGMEVKLYTKSVDENKKISVSYTVSGVAESNGGKSYLYWNFHDVGENIDSIKNAKLDIRLNNSEFDLNTLSCEVLGDGEFSIDENESRIDIQGKNLTNTFKVELYFNEGYLVNNDEVIDNNQDGIYIDDDIIFDENLDYDFNGIVEGEDNFFAIFFGGIVVVMCILIFVYMINEGKYMNMLDEYRQSCDLSDLDEIYFDMPSNIDPAVVSLLYKEGRINTQYIVTSLLFYLRELGYYSTIASKEEGDLTFVRDLNKELPEKNHLAFVVNWFKEYEENGIFNFNDIRKKIKSRVEGRKFLENLKELDKLILKHGENEKCFILVKGRKTLTNEMYKEREKWIRYRKHLKNIFKDNAEYSFENPDLVMIYAIALDLDNNDFGKWIQERKEYRDTFDYYCFYNTMIFMEDSYRSINMSNDSSSIGGFDSGSSGGDCGGGSCGGGDSGAF